MSGMEWQFTCCVDTVLVKLDIDDGEFSPDVDGIEDGS